MPITTTAFTTSQVIGFPSRVSIEDTSVGSDAAVDHRRIYFQKSDGTYLVPEGTEEDYVLFPLGADTLDIDDLLDRDYALSVTVQWCNAAGAALYTKTVLTLFTLTTKEFLYTLTQAQTSRPAIISDATYYQKKLELFCEVKSAENATEIGGDIAATQGCLDRAQLLIDHQTLYF